MSERLHRPTLAALGVLAFGIKATVHELIGHGGAAVAMGCKPLAVSSAWWDGDCSAVADVAQAVRVVKAGGTFANLVVAVLAGAAFVVLSRRSKGTGVFFLWLLFVTNLLSGGGYMMVDPIFGFGDWTAFIETYGAGGSLRWAIVAAGVVCSVAGLTLGRRLLRPWLGEEQGERRRRSRELCLIPYLAGASAVPLSALLNPHGPVFAATSALSTFGGCAWLVWIGLDPVSQGGVVADGTVAPGRGWFVACGVALLLLFAVLGPSVSFG